MCSSDLDAIRTFAGQLPILGVCLGHQAIGQAYGGKVVRAKRVMHGKHDDVIHKGQAEAINHYAPDYGFDVDVKKFDFAKLVENRQAYISRIHTSYNNVLAKNNVDVIRGFAKFVNKNTLEVTFADGTTEQVTADHKIGRAHV